MASEILFQFFLSQPTFLELFHVGEGSSSKNLLALEQIFTELRVTEYRREL